MERTQERMQVFSCQMSPQQEKGESGIQQYEINEVIHRFRRQMIAYMNRPEVELENAIPSATQELGYSYYMQKKRLHERGMRIHYAKYMHLDSGISQSFTARKQAVCKEMRGVDYDIRYVRNGKVVGSESQQTYLNHYIFRAKNEQGLYTCPACGAVQPLEVLLDGCDYCKAKFDINAYHDCVACVCGERATKYIGKEEREKRKKNNYKWSIIGAVSFSLIFCLPWMLLNYFSDLATGMKIFMMLLFVGVFFFSLTLMAGGLIWVSSSQYKATKRYDNVYDAIHKYNPDFNMEAFAALMDCKIKTMFYAKEIKEVSAFVLFDMKAFLSQNANVVSCQVNEIELLNFRTDDTYQYIDVCRHVRLQRDMGTHLMPESKYLYMTLCKNRNYKIKRDVVMYRCPCCSASISLKEGGVCQYCGAKLDYRLYDWAVVGMKYGARPFWAKRNDF